MNFNGFLIIISLLHLFNNISEGQEQPEKPVITHVTVDTATNNTILSWLESSSPEVTHYVIYIETGPEDFFPLDTVSAPANQYIHLNSGAGNMKLRYAIAAGTSKNIYSEIKPGIHGTVFAGIQYDSCYYRNIVSWTKYSGWGNSVSGYRVYGSVNNMEFILLNGLTANDSVYYHYEIEENTHYSYLVEAVKNDGLVSLSNIARKFTYMPGPPLSLIAEYTEVTDRNLVKLVFSVVDTSSIKKYALLRASDRTADFILSKFIIHEGSGNIIVYDSIITGRESFYYKLGALNPCNKLIKESNLAVNILLKGESGGNSADLAWNPYEDFPEGVNEYIIYARTYEGTHQERAKTSAGNNKFRDNLFDINHQAHRGELIYKVTAVENFTGITAISNETQVTVESEIFVPNAFTPNDDGINDVFFPVFNFLPEEFTLIIYDRYGIRVFGTNNPETGWDGTVKGKKASEGVYMYYIEYKSFSGRRQNLTGNITLFYPY